MIPATDVSFEVFVLTELLVVWFGGLLSAVCLRSYRRTRGAHFRYATFGFVMITIGGTVESLYQVGLRDYRLIGSELFLVQSVESLLLAAGLGVLFYSIYAYRPTRGRPGEGVGVEFDARDD